MDEAENEHDQHSGDAEPRRSSRSPPVSPAIGVGDAASKRLDREYQPGEHRDARKRDHAPRQRRQALRARGTLPGLPASRTPRPKSEDASAATPPGKPRGSPVIVRSVPSLIHTCYRVLDLDRSVGFYEKLGLAEIGRMPDSR